MGSSSDIVTEPVIKWKQFLVIISYSFIFDASIGKIRLKQIFFRERQVQYSKLLLSGLFHYHVSKVSRKLSLVFEFIDQIHTNVLEMN